MPQRGWMNDLNGGLYHCEKYHMFYLSSPDQGKPYLTKKKWKNKYWGHSTSKDLVTWEEKKTALIPHSDEYRCMSGSIFFLNKIQYLIYSYSKIEPSNAEIVQCISTGSYDLENWDNKHIPVLTIDSHDGPSFENNWRDPYVFNIESELYMLLGVVLENKPCLAIYKNFGQKAYKWKYMNIFFSDATSNISFYECPKFFKIGKKWILIVSPHLRSSDTSIKHGNVFYYTGILDRNDLTFKPLNKGYINYSKYFYAAEDIKLKNGNVALLGWVPGWNPKKYTNSNWNGYASLTRELALNGNELLQLPIKSTRKKRKNKSYKKNEIKILNNYNFELEGISQSEIELNFEKNCIHKYGFNLILDEENILSTYYQNGQIFINNKFIKHDYLKNSHIFFDNCSVELFFNDGDICFTDLFSSSLYKYKIKIYSDSEMNVTCENWIIIN